MSEAPAGRLRRALGVGALVAAAALLAWEGIDRRPGPLDPAPPEEPSAAALRVETSVSAVQERFHALERVALGHAETLAAEALRAVPRPSGAPADRAALFEVLSRVLGEERRPLSGVAVVDPEGRPLAWWGRIFSGTRMPLPGDRPRTHVVRTRVYRVVMAEIPLRMPDGAAARDEERERGEEEPAVSPEVDTRSASRGWTCVHGRGSRKRRSGRRISGARTSRSSCRGCSAAS